jgi:helicase SWR1
MGLGKTIQTISLLAYLAVYKGIWGPHLVVVPTSCIVNWESEFKRWSVFVFHNFCETACLTLVVIVRCPAFKILTYYGGSKTRKQLRVGWSKLNAFHVCITSYQLVVQDASSFKRKQWYYMILDEAHNIKVRDNLMNNER